jgi:cell division protein ZapE
MDSFYSVVPVVRKTRVHFHEFMRAVHSYLDDLKNVIDPLDEVAKLIAQKYRLICFDEFHVSDIADAMILYNLLKALFRNRVSFIITSNYEPSTLYPNGLHRDRILPTIKLLQENMDVVNIDTNTDYRRCAKKNEGIYHFPLNISTDSVLDSIFKKLAKKVDEDTMIHVQARAIKALRHSAGVLWFDFNTLCGGARSQNDYLEIASHFHTVILSNIPQMTAEMSSEARRFTWLVDVFYEQNIKLIMSAEVEPEKLYIKGVLANEFRRTVSRIMEMQSLKYMNGKWCSKVESII